MKSKDDDRSIIGGASGTEHTAASLLDVCLDCDHYQDNVNTDEPIDPPCRLAVQWNVCTLKEMARRVASGRTRHPNPCCPWNQVVK